VRPSQPLGQVDDILVRLHPNDYAVISGNPDLMTIATRTRIRFDSDVTIAQGWLFIESENGLIDARLENDWARSENNSWKCCMMRTLESLFT